MKRSAGQVDRLEKLINDLLDVSKINAGKLLFNYEIFDFSQMLKQTIAGMQEIYPSHVIQLETDIEQAYNGDRFRIEQVVQNFLSNAIKYSPGADKVNVSASIADGNIIVSVKDDGIGIEPENLGKLFERYYRADNSSSRFDGLGLGLFISAEIIKRHSGSFWIDSEPGKGSTFSFKLPIDPHLQIEAEIRTESYYKDRYIRIHCPKESEIMHVEWTGYQDMRSVKHGGSLMIDYLRKNKRSKVFNDNRLVPGTWSEASDWAATVWLPLMELAGLRFFAWILSSSAFSQLSAKKSVDNEEKSAEISFFNSAEQGMEWLEKQ
jgi:anti-sigma regulatory factor (Ser/Thr protein kinase)